MSIISTAVSTGLDALKKALASKSSTTTPKANTTTTTPTPTKSSASSSNNSSTSKTSTKSTSSSSKSSGLSSIGSSASGILSTMKDELDKQKAAATPMATSTPVTPTTPATTPVAVSKPASSSGLGAVINNAIQTAAEATGTVTNTGKTPTNIADTISVMKDKLGQNTAAEANTSGDGLFGTISNLLNNSVQTAAEATGTVTDTGKTPETIGDALKVMSGQVSGKVAYSNMSDAEKLQLQLEQEKNNQQQLTQQLIKILTDNLNSNPDYSAIYDEILAKLPSEQPIETLSFDDALERAKSQLNPLYDQSASMVADNMDFQNIQSGFYGQMPGDVLKAKALTQEGNTRASSIAALANELVGQSENAALQQQQLAAQKEAQRLSLLESIRSGVANQKQSSIQSLMSALGLVGDQTQQKQNYLLSVKDMGLKEASQALDEYVQTGQLSIQERSQILNEKKEAFQQQLETDKWSYQKELSNKQMSLDEAQSKVDEAIKKGQLSLQQGQLALQLKEYDLNAYKASNDVSLKQQELDWVKSDNNPDNIYKSAQASAAASKASEPNQDAIDNMALATARTMLNSKGEEGLQSWWNSNKVELSEDLSTATYKNIEALVYPD